MSEDKKKRTPGQIRREIAMVEEFSKVLPACLARLRTELHEAEQREAMK